MQIKNLVILGFAFWSCKLFSCEAPLSESYELRPQTFSKSEETRYSSRRVVWGTFKNPSEGNPFSVGTYAGGCIGGANTLASDGEGFHVMRPSRNRYYGHADLIEVIQKIAEKNLDLKQGRLLVGDMGQPRGGPMSSGHASHQMGLDADIWQLFWKQSRSPSASERENLSSVSLLRADERNINPRTWTTGHGLLLKEAASLERVQRIFINPHIKKKMCSLYPNKKDYGWMKKLRPWYGHDYHFHVRIVCPKKSPDCMPQTDELPADNGCGSDLVEWFLPDGRVRSPDPSTASGPTINLPVACKAVEGT